MSKEKTAIQTAIANLERKQKTLAENYIAGLINRHELIHKQNEINSIQLMLANLLPKERQDLIEAHDSKFKIIEQIPNSIVATVTYKKGSDYVKEKFGI